MKAQQSTAAAPPVVAEDRTRDVHKHCEAMMFRTTPKLAVLILRSQAESGVDRGGSSPALDSLGWRGIEMLCLDVLRDIEQLCRAAGMQQGEFAVLPDDEGGGL
jgi:hypothetical protein